TGGRGHRPCRARNRARRCDRARHETPCEIAGAFARAGAVDRRRQYRGFRRAAGCSEARGFHGRAHLHHRHRFGRFAIDLRLRHAHSRPERRPGYPRAELDRGLHRRKILPGLRCGPARRSLSQHRRPGTAGARAFAAAPARGALSVAARRSHVARMHLVALARAEIRSRSVRMTIADLHFLRPSWWLAALPLPLMLLAMSRNQHGRAALASLADANLLPYLVRGGGRRRFLALALAATIWLLAVAALAGPSWQRQPAPLYANGAARVIVLSLASDMRAQDAKPDRMTRARYAVRDLLDEAGDARTALIGYAGDAFVVAPLTPDKATVLNLLQALDPDVMPAPGNDAARAIAQALDLLKQAHVEGGEMVLVTDVADSSAIAAARAARAAGVRVDVLGVGSAQGAPVPKADGGFERDAAGNVRIARRDDDALRETADAGGGRYAPLGSDGGGVSAIGAPTATQSAATGGEHADLWRDGGAWLLLALLPLTALAFRRGWVCVLALAFALPQARASGLDSLWSRPDQRAMQALQHGDYARAQ